MSTEIINRETVMTGRAFNVQRLQVRLPDQRQTHYDLVDHRDSMTVVPLDDEGRLLFVRQFRMGSASDLLELPAGVLEDGEDPAVCAGRELREETGMAARHIQKLGEFYLAPGYCNEYMHIYLATGLYPAPLDSDLDEFLAVEAVPLSQALEMARGGQLRDAKTVAALFLALPFFQK